METEGILLHIGQRIQRSTLVEQLNTQMISDAESLGAAKCQTY